MNILPKTISKIFSILFFVALIVFIGYKLYDRNVKMQSHSFTLGHVFDENKTGGKSGQRKWIYSYKVNNKLYRSNSSVSLKRKLKKGDYCVVKYSIENPEISTIFYEESPVIPKQELLNFKTINARVLVLGKPFKDLIFIKYEYSSNKNTYTFGSRVPVLVFQKHYIDSSSIKINVSNKFPELNDLYFKSVIKEKH